MIKNLWVNLPVRDIVKARKFHSDIGFKSVKRHESSSDCIGLSFGDQGVIVMLFEEERFSHFAGQKISDAKTSAEVLLSFELDSKKAVDDFAKNVQEKGGDLYAPPAAIGDLYGAAFRDLDQHCWNFLYMGGIKKN